MGRKRHTPDLQIITALREAEVDPTFSRHSHGFRPGRRAHDAARRQHCGRQKVHGLARGKSVKLISRELGIAEQTYYRWRREYGGMKVSQARHLKELAGSARRPDSKRENGQMTSRAVADWTELDKLGVFRSWRIQRPRETAYREF